MKRPEQPAGIIYDVDDTLLDNQIEVDGSPVNLHEIARLGAVHHVAGELGGDYIQLGEVDRAENAQSFTQSPFHTVSGAFFTLLQNRNLISGDIDPEHPIIKRLIELKNETYGTLLAVHGKAVPGADSFVRDFAAHYGTENTNAIASTAVLADIKTFLAMSHLSYLFPDERIFDVSKVSNPKPHPEVFDKAYKSLNLPKHTPRGDVVAFEDDPRGMLSARKAGLYVCAITTRYPRDFLARIDAQPDFIADTYDEFRHHFNLVS